MGVAKKAGRAVRRERRLVEELEKRELFVVTPIAAAGAINGGTVSVYNAQSGAVLSTFHPFGTGYRASVSVAVADVTGDGNAEVVVSPEKVGSVPIVEVFSSTGVMLSSFMAFPTAFRGGVQVAAGYFNGDVKADIVVGAGPGGSPVVKLFNGANNALLQQFFAFTTAFHGGVNVAAGDVNADGTDDFVVCEKAGGQTILSVFNGTNHALLRSEFPLDGPGATGARVAAGDVNGDGHADLIVGLGAGTGSFVEVIDGANAGILLDTFSPFGNGVTTGISVGTVDVNADGSAEVMVGNGRGASRLIRVYDGTTHTLVRTISDPASGATVGDFVAGQVFRLT